MVGIFIIPLAELTDEQTGKLIVGSLILIVTLLMLFGAVALYRKWLKSDDSGSGEGFTLSDLRKLHKAGQMTDEEFEKAKKVLIGSVKATAEKMGHNPTAGPRSDLKDPKQGPRTIPPRFDADSPEK
jgi:hypothetical protein